MIILIDDDKLIHLSWKMKASSLNVRVRCFFSISAFLNEQENYKDAQIYIDSSLGNGIQGEVEAKKLFDAGFQNLYLTTGYTDLRVEDYPWLKGIVSKKPPF